jgi:hypothetical protein
VGAETWLLMWYCVTITNPACKKWDGATERLIPSFSSEADCVSYAKKIERKVHTSLHFELEYVCRKGVSPEPYTPSRRPSFQTETLLLNEDTVLYQGTGVGESWNRPV